MPTQPGRGDQPAPAPRRRSGRRYDVNVVFIHIPDATVCYCSLLSLPMAIRYVPDPGRAVNGVRCPLNAWPHAVYLH